MSDAGPLSVPLTPEQSRAQVMDAAREIVATLNLPVLRAAFWHASCSDAGRPPFRAQVRISYPAAADDAQTDAEIAEMIRRLTDEGWAGDPDFRSHSPAVTKNKVTVVFRTPNASVATPAIEVLGECRDITTPGRLVDGAEWVTLS